MEFKEVIKKRYSCRRYSDKPVEQEKVDAILEAGRIAPTAKNNQPHHIYVVRSEEARSKVDSVCRCRYGAPLMLVVTADKSKAFTYPDNETNSAVEDAAIVATHMMLAAEDEGLNTCWVNAFSPAEVGRALGLPENERVVMMLDVGYKAMVSPAAPMHLMRRSIKNSVTEL